MITAEGALLSEYRFTLGHVPPQMARVSASRAPPSFPDLPCRLCGHMSPRHFVERFEGFCSERHKWEWLVVIILPLFVDRLELNTALLIRI